MRSTYERMLEVFSPIRAEALRAGRRMLNSDEAQKILAAYDPPGPFDE
jgi:hypothetical protein